MKAVKVGAIALAMFISWAAGAGETLLYASHVAERNLEAARQAVAMARAEKQAELSSCQEAEIEMQRQLEQARAAAAPAGNQNMDIQRCSDWLDAAKSLLK